jgi:DNA gyrase subunit B
MGAGIAEDFKVEKIRYGKVIILTDADADGMHIGTLLMAFFFQFCKPLIDEGRLFLGKSPLYGIYPKEGAKKKKDGRDVFWAYSDEELETLLKKEKLTTPRIVRFKGLGEMNPSTLWDTTLNPAERTLLRIRASDAEFAAASLKELMGTDPVYRAKLIQDRAESIELDV